MNHQSFYQPSSTCKQPDFPPESYYLNRLIDLWGDECWDDSLDETEANSVCVSHLLVDTEQESQLNCIQNFQ
ncbi:hypothetical protein [Crocosphaera chwakensis]|uniref:Uncharacterized protein n=1 Tax=Crocosphaera chwakensis CCY0110 TaxID=391612 RepID=A3IVJ0_9CHRO|nr:hypothetical protein [Crocosphaera chwakensis]EAZ89465.1 hypothetical protein CY0110_01440 [Crocosphaera chwakensis CCY0110]